MATSAIVDLETVRLTDPEEQVKVLLGDSWETRDVEKLRVDREEIHRNAEESNKNVVDCKQAN